MINMILLLTIIILLELLVARPFITGAFCMLIPAYSIDNFMGLSHAKMPILASSGWEFEILEVKF